MHCTPFQFFFFYQNFFYPPQNCYLIQTNKKTKGEKNYWKPYGSSGEKGVMEHGLEALNISRVKSSPLKCPGMGRGENKAWDLTPSFPAFLWEREPAKWSRARRGQRDHKK